MPSAVKSGVNGCGGTMRIVSFIEDYNIIDKIIKHLNLTFKATRPPPPQAQFSIAAEEQSEYIWNSNPLVQGGKGRSLFFINLHYADFLMFSLFLGYLVDRTCFLCVLLMMKSLRWWEFGEMEEKFIINQKTKFLSLKYISPNSLDGRLDIFYYWYCWVF